MQFFQGSHLRDLRCPHSTLGASESKLQMPPPTMRYMPLAEKGSLEPEPLEKKNNLAIIKIKYKNNQVQFWRVYILFKYKQTDLTSQTEPNTQDMYL